VAFDGERARRDTPGVAPVAHLNNAGAALPPSVVTEAVIAQLRLEAQLGGYEAAEAARDQVQVHDQGLRRCGIVTFAVDGVPAPQPQRLRPPGAGEQS
jgi:hypothetical protein